MNAIVLPHVVSWPAIVVSHNNELDTTKPVARRKCARCVDCKKLITSNVRCKVCYKKHQLKKKSVRKIYLVHKSSDATKRSGKYVDRDILETLWEKQKGMCALSGLALTHSYMQEDVPHKYVTNASVDRIDPLNYEYTEDNTQLVCSAINLMKHTFDENTFIWLCRLVVNHTKERELNPPTLTKTLWYFDWRKKGVKSRRERLADTPCSETDSLETKDPQSDESE